MFAVITDDLTGASEIAGVALAKGFKSVIETQSVRPTDADVLVVATDMRSLSASCAARKSARLTEEVLALQPEFIFKKVDSVLRGNIGPELEAQMQVEKKPCALLVPANPSRNRTIADGIYYVDKTPVAESDFAINHDFAAPTSNVVDILLNRGTSSAIWVSPGDRFASSGVHVGNTRNAIDMHRWAITVNEEVVPAGGADFFAALLDARVPNKPLNGAAEAPFLGEHVLYVCGSNFPASQQSVLKAVSGGACVADMPSELYYSPGIDSAMLDQWKQQACNCLLEHGTIIIAATHTPRNGSLDGRLVTQAMASVSASIVGSESVDDLLIEGGATAQAVMEALDIDSLIPTQTLAHGVTRMKVNSHPNLHITMKPGSYDWPESIWKNSN